METSRRRPEIEPIVARIVTLQMDGYYAYASRFANYTEAEPTYFAIVMPQDEYNERLQAVHEVERALWYAQQRRAERTSEPLASELSLSKTLPWQDIENDFRYCVSDTELEALKHSAELAYSFANLGGTAIEAGLTSDLDLSQAPNTALDPELEAWIYVRETVRDLNN